MWDSRLLFREEGQEFPNELDVSHAERATWKLPSFLCTGGPRIRFGEGADFHLQIRLFPSRIEVGWWGTKGDPGSRRR
jgi:hypothetical protein